VLAEVDMHDLRGPAVVADRDAGVGGGGGAGGDRGGGRAAARGECCQRKESRPGGIRERSPHEAGPRSPTLASCSDPSAVICGSSLVGAALTAPLNRRCTTRSFPCA